MFVKIRTTICCRPVKVEKGVTGGGDLFLTQNYTDFEAAASLNGQCRLHLHMYKVSDEQQFC